jgi:hypothetical protein
MFACFGLKRMDVFSTGDLGVQYVSDGVYRFDLRLTVKQKRYGNIHRPRHNQAQKQRRKMEVRILPSPLRTQSSQQPSNSQQTKQVPTLTLTSLPSLVPGHLKDLVRITTHSNLFTHAPTQIHDRAGDARPSLEILALPVRSSPPSLSSLLCSVTHAHLEEKLTLMLGRSSCGICGESRTLILACCSSRRCVDVKVSVVAWEAAVTRWYDGSLVCIERIRLSGCLAVGGDGWMDVGRVAVHGTSLTCNMHMSMLEVRNRVLSCAVMCCARQRVVFPLVLIGRRTFASRRCWDVWFASRAVVLLAMHRVK